MIQSILLFFCSTLKIRERELNRRDRVENGHLGARDQQSLQHQVSLHHDHDHVHVHDHLLVYLHVHVTFH